MRIDFWVCSGCTLIQSIIACIVGFGDIPTSKQHISTLEAIFAYSVYDLALLVLLRAGIYLLPTFPLYSRIAPTLLSLILLYMQGGFVLVKIFYRIVSEDVSELAQVTLTDELFYASCLCSFLAPLVERLALRLHQNARGSSTSSDQELLLVPSTPSSPAPEEEFSKVTVWRLVSLVWTEKTPLAFAFVFLVIAAVSQATIPHFIGQALNAVKEHKSVSGPLTGLVVGTICVSLFSSLRGSTFIVLGARVNRNMRGELFKTILGQNMGFFDSVKTGELSSRMTQDVQKVCDQVQLNVNYFVRNLIATVVTLAFMLGLSWRLTCLSMISIPFTAVVVHKYGEVMKDVSKKVQDQLAECNAASEESFSNIHTVRSFGAETLEASRFDALLQKAYIITRRLARLNVPFQSASKALPYLSTVAIIYYGAKLSLAGVIDPGVLISFMLYLDTLNDSFSAMGDIYASITAALGAADRVFALLDKKPDMSTVEMPIVSATETDSVKGHLEFKNVTFAYPSRSHITVLNGVSLEIKAGSVVALVGKSGQGKSSCLALLQRWYIPTTGEILLDGVSIKRFQLEEYHKIVTCVNQEPLLFARTIRENIFFGLFNPGDAIPADMEAELVRCAKLANAHSFISALPEGYDTQVGMRGVQLSGGQKQRIAIARALVRKPKVLLLDEATSALDSESEKQVQFALDSMMTAEITLVVVAHRLSTVRNADVIYMVDKGVVVEGGTHDDLVKDETSAYFKLVQNQLMSDPIVANL